MSSKKVFVTLTYASSGAQPPIFLAGSFSEPPWDPQEMEFTTDKNGETQFHKEVELAEGGEYQYKFRIGLGDWWALNEQAPMITDELGNRNNLLAVPAAKGAVEKPKTSEPAAAPSPSNMPVPEVFVEKLDDEPRHGDDFGPVATTGQKDAHDMRAMDAEPDLIVIRSQTNTPIYAQTATEVADSAATLDREPSPAPISDEEAGRTGERRMSRTPIPQVALTAAEVADTAAILDQDDGLAWTDKYEHHDMRMNLPQIHYPYDTSSGPTTPWHDQAPLFAHELLGSNEAELASPITSESLPSPTNHEPEEDVIDLNDPTLERFPEDRTSILTHIRSCESRMSEDETNVQGVPPSPITKPKSRSPSIDMPGSGRLDAQPSPGLDVITEEHQEEDGFFGGLPGPSQKLQTVNEVRLPEELKAIQEAEEPVEDPKTVLDNLDRIEDATADSHGTTVKEESAKLEGDQHMSVDETSAAEEGNMIDSTIKKVEDRSEKAESLSHAAIGNGEKSQPGPRGNEIQSESEENVVGAERYADLQDKSPVDKISDTSEHVPGHSDHVHGNFEKHFDEASHKSDQFQSQPGRVNDILIGGVIIKDIPSESSTKVRDVAQDSTPEVLTKQYHFLETDAHQSAVTHENSQTELDSTLGTDLPIPDTKADEVPLTTEHGMPGSDSQVGNASRNIAQSAILRNPQAVVENVYEDDLHLSQMKASDEAPLIPKHDVLGSEISKSVMDVKLVSANFDNTPETDLTIPQMTVDEQISAKPVHQVLDSEVDKSAPVEDTYPDGTIYDADIPLSKLKPEDALLGASQLASGTSGSNDVGVVESTLTNGVDGAKAKSVDAASLNIHDNEPELGPHETAPPTIERPLTPSSIHSDLKARLPESRLGMIWAYVIGELNWLGRTVFGVCSGDRGPLLVVSAVLVLGPLLAMYFLQL